MKYTAVVVLVLCLFALSAFATPPHFEHIVIIIQENRTPDNLFGGNPTFESGVNISRATDGQAWGLDACFNPTHTHVAWEKQWPNDGTGLHSCDSVVKEDACHGSVPACPQDTYVNSADVQPYLDIAQRYGFANLMFQTTEGPSFPAHHVLFAGTSVPDITGNIGTTPTNQYFVSGNTDDTDDATCTANLVEKAHDVSPDDVESFAFLLPGLPAGAHLGYPCYQHSTLADLIDHAGKSWRYYAWKKPGSIWNAPYSINSLCQPSGHGPGATCTGSHFTGVNPDVTTTPGQILLDLDPNSSNPCSLKNVSWVVPDGNWSDHPGGASTKLGPAWVASIVNKIGYTTCNDNGNPYWRNTLILITWDDWGGFYDHVPPYDVIRNPGTWGSAYVSGFRVPLLVVSAYTQAGTVSGAGVADGSHCKDANVFYCHDFGSILKFIELNFGLLEVGSLDGLNYADHFAPDNKNPNIPLSEFFNVPGNQPRTFQSISMPPGSPSESYFTTYTGAVEPDDEE